MKYKEKSYCAKLTKPQFQIKGSECKEFTTAVIQGVISRQTNRPKWQSHFVLH